MELAPGAQGRAACPPITAIEISRLTAFLDDEIGILVKSLGPDRIVFGNRHAVQLSRPGPAQSERPARPAASRRSRSWD